MVISKQKYKEIKVIQDFAGFPLMQRWPFSGSRRKTDLHSHSRHQLTKSFLALTQGYNERPTLSIQVSIYRINGIPVNSTGCLGGKSKFLCKENSKIERERGKKINHLELFCFCKNKSKIILNKIVNFSFFLNCFPILFDTHLRATG